MVGKLTPKPIVRLIGNARSRIEGRVYDPAYGSRWVP